MSKETEIAAKVLAYRQTGQCDDAKLKRGADDNPGAPRYTVAQLYLWKPMEPAKKAAPKKKATRKKATKKK